MVRRAIAVGSIAVTGAALAVGGGIGFGDAAGPTALALSALGSLTGIALVAGAGYLYRSDVRTSHVARVPGWNLLGAALLGGVLALATFGAGVSLPLFVLVDVLGISAVAHVLIGYNDVRRIRDRALELSTIHEELRAFQTVLDGDLPDETVELEPIVDRVLDAYREEYPDATVEADVPDGLTVRADGQLTTALDHLVENALEHGSPDSGDPFVRVSATRDGRTVRLTVADRGPGVPDDEVAVRSGERDIDQLSHGSGLGLWVVTAIAERYGGSLDFGRLARARPSR